MIRKNRWYVAECDAPGCGAESPGFPERDWVVQWMIRHGWYLSGGRCYCEKHAQAKGEKSNE